MTHSLLSVGVLVSFTDWLCLSGSTFLIIRRMESSSCAVPYQPFRRSTWKRCVAHSPHRSTQLTLTCNPALNARLSPTTMFPQIAFMGEVSDTLIQQLRHFMSLYKQHAQHLLSVLCSCSFTEVTHLHPPQLQLCVPKRSLKACASH
jgi:hypothetical protein